MKLTCWIVDDEPLALELLDSYVQKTPFLKLTGKFSSAIQAMNNMSGERVDVIFLDIQMPEVSGMELPVLSTRIRGSFSQPHSASMPWTDIG